MKAKVPAVAIAVVAVLATLCLSGSAPGATSKAIDGRFDVGGHKLYLHCEGTASPTVIYIHGYAWDNHRGAENAGAIPAIVGEKHRVCVYDRPNLGKSDKLPGPITAKQTIEDLHALLRAAGVKPPYVLLGASFGGLVAYTYAATYPGEVKGMLLLDAAFPTELSLEHFFPQKDRLSHGDWKTGVEKTDQLDVYELANKLAAKEPTIPVIYLLATPETWTSGTPAAYNAVVLGTLAKYVAGFSPGVVKHVKSPHFMEAAVPNRIAGELELLIAETH